MWKLINLMVGLGSIEDGNPAVPPYVQLAKFEVWWPIWPGLTCFVCFFIIGLTHMYSPRMRSRQSWGRRWRVLMSFQMWWLQVFEAIWWDGDRWMSVASNQVTRPPPFYLLVVSHQPLQGKSHIDHVEEMTCEHKKAFGCPLFGQIPHH